MKKGEKDDYLAFKRTILTFLSIKFTSFLLNACLKNVMLVTAFPRIETCGFCLYFLVHLPPLISRYPLVEGGFNSRLFVIFGVKESPCFISKHFLHLLEYQTYESSQNSNFRKFLGTGKHRPTSHYRHRLGLNVFA